MITQVLHCPYCHGTDIVRHGTTPEGKQRYRCRACPERGRMFLLEYTYAGQSPDVKQQIVEMAMNASGIRDTARVLHVSPTTVIKYAAPRARHQGHASQRQRSATAALMACPLAPAGASRFDHPLGIPGHFPQMPVRILEVARVPAPEGVIRGVDHDGP